MSEIEELDDLNRLMMFYSASVFDKISGKNVGSLSIEEKQKYLYEKIFNDKSRIYSANDIISALDTNLETTGSSPNSLADITSLINTAAAVESATDLFSLSTLRGTDLVETAAFGIIEPPPSEGNNYISSLISESQKASISEDKDMAIIHVKKNFLHPSYHSTYSSEVFLNYIPVIERSRCLPVFKVEVFSRGSYNTSIEIWDGNSGTGSSTNLTGTLSKYTEKLDSLAVFNFLTGDPSIEGNRYSTADGAMTLASTEAFSGTTIGTGEDTKTSEAYSILKDGMEMFTMPQSLISKKPGTNIDPFRPFMSLKKATINTESVGEGILAWNTATLIVEVYDRHRLEDISFFLDPTKFGHTSFELTAGWSHQDPSSSYGKCINKMRTKELYQLVSSKFTFNDAGVVTITMRLAMQGRRSLANSSMFAADEGGQSVRDAYNKLESALLSIQTGTSALNNRRSRGNLLPTSVITQRENQSAMELNPEALNQVRTALAGAGADAMSEEDRQKFDEALIELNNNAISNYYTLLENYVDTFLEDIGLDSSSMPIRTLPGDTRYEYRYTADGWTYKDGNETPPTWKKMTGGLDVIGTAYGKDEAAFNSRSDGTSVSFDKLFTNAISKRMLTGDESVIDEVHTFVYEFNEKAPGVGNTSIGAFNINKTTITEKLKEKIKETQNLSIVDFISCVKSMMKDKLDSQFNIIADTEGGTSGDDKRTTIRNNRDLISQENANIREIDSNIQKKQSESSSATGTRKESIDAEIGVLQTSREASIQEIARLTKVIDDLFESGELSAMTSTRTSKLRMPELKVIIETKRTVKNRKILRVHIYDGNAKPNELEEFLANLGKTISHPVNINNILSSSDNSEGDSLLSKLISKGVVDIIPIEIDGESTHRIKTNLRSSEFKSAIKESMPSITYGVEGTAINKISIDGVSDADMQAHYLLQSQRQASSNVTNTAAEGHDIEDDDAQKLMPVNMSLTTMGCPMLRYGQEFFIDLDTNTDIDNVYSATKITHNISAGTFTTTVEMKANFSSEVSFSRLLSDIHFLSNYPSVEHYTNTE